MAPRLGLAMSGGGYRAAAFHLGVLRGLHEAGLLSHVRVVSGVSGGALLAAAWVCRSDVPFDVFEQEMRGLLARDLKRRVLVAAFRPDRALRLLVSPRYSLTEVLADVLDRDLFGGRSLGALRNVTPRLVLNATTLNHGTGFRMTPDRLGDWLLSTRDRRRLDRFRVARAVAASAAFPGGFAPLVVGPEVWGERRHGPREVLLTDGGVDDNFGVEPLAGCETVIVSDGSYPFEPDLRPLDHFGLTTPARLLLAVVLVGLAVLGSERLGLPGVLLAALAGAAVLAILRLRLALYLFGTVMMRGQRRGVLRRMFGRDVRRSCTWLGLGTALDAEDDAALAEAGVDRRRLQKVRTDLDLDAQDLDGLVTLGAALVRRRVVVPAKDARGIG